MTRIDCPVCPASRSASVITSAGEHVATCAGCNDPDWVNPFPLTDDPTEGRIAITQEA